LIYNLVHDLDDETLQGTFRAMGADIYVRESQGEATLASIMKCLQSGGNLADIPNCYINSTSSFQFTKHVPENNPIEECSIDWDSFEDWELGDTVQMRTARSCAFKCSFCDYPLRAGALSAAEVATVERELRQLARRRVRNVVFIDDTFNVPIGRFCKICEMMIANDFPFSWFSYFRCSNAKDPAVFDLLSHSGCAGVFLGVESADETVLANMNKRAHGDDYRRGIAEFNKRNIASFASLIVGFPGETQQSITNTINFLNEACPTFYRVEPLWYNVRAPIAKDAERFGLSGSAFRWKHSTMEANTAADGAQRIFEEVHGPAWMPMYMFDFWALPYLMGKGMKLQEMVEFHQHAYRAMSCAIAGESSAPPLNDIARMFSKTELQPSRYRLEPSVLTE
jgi:radical SAM PhpK family P-methyltransferase